MNFRRSITVGRNLSFYKIGWDDFLLYGPGWDAFGPGWDGFWVRGRPPSGCTLPYSAHWANL